MSYCEIGHLSADQVLTRADIAHSDEEVRWLVSCIERLRRGCNAGCERPELHRKVKSFRGKAAAENEANT